MQELQVLNNSKTLDSREVAEMLGKSHGAVMKDIQGSKDGNSIGIIPVLLKSNFDLSDYFIESSYKDGSGKTNKCYLVTKMGCEMLGNKLQGEKGILFTAKYVKAFNKMEQAIQSPKKLTVIEQLKLQNEAILDVDKKVDVVIEEVEGLKNNTTINYGQQQVINKTAKKRVVDVLGGKYTKAYKELSGKVFASFWNDYRKVMQAATYRDTLVKDYEKALKYIEGWKPNRDLELMIIGCNAQIEMEEI